MNSMRRNLRVFSTIGLMLTILTLSACYTLTDTPTPSGAELLAAETNVTCETCAQATQIAALTQVKIDSDNQSVATAEVLRANAQATMDSANATLSAVQTQDQNNANIIAAQIAGTAEIVRANAQATLNSAGATQSAALTQDAIGQTQMADLATTTAAALMIQQNNDALAAGTQTAVVNDIATQTQVAAATSQWYADQARQRDEQRQGSLTFLWMWCFPFFVVLLAGLALWGFWRWQQIQQANQRILENPLGRLPAAEIIDYPPDDSTPYLESNIVNRRHPLTTPDDQVHEWLDEVKSKLLENDKKDEDDHTDN